MSAFDNDDSKPGHCFELRSRSLDALNYPVPTFRPKWAGRTIALDLHPSEGATEQAGNGFSWFDACDADVMHSNANPVRCARLGIRSEGAVFGAVSYNGAAAFSAFVETGTQLRWGWNATGHYYPVADNAYQIGSSANRVLDVFISGISTPVSGYPATPTPSSLVQIIQQLKAQIVAMSGRMDRAGLAP